MKEKKNTLTRRRKWPPSQPAKQGTRGVTHNSKLWPRRTFFPSATRGGRIATVRSIVLRNCGELPLSAESSELYIGKLEWMEGKKEGTKEGTKPGFGQILGGLHSYSIYFSRPFLLPTRGTLLSPSSYRKFSDDPRTPNKR